MAQCDANIEQRYHESLNPGKLRDFLENKLPPIDLLDTEKFSKILLLDSMKELINGREVIFKNTIQNACEANSDRIIINPRYSLEESLKFTINKLRKNQLNSRYNRNKLDIDQLIVYNRAIEADTTVYLIRVLWEMKLSNVDRDLFYTMTANKPIRSPSKVYEKIASKNWRSLYNGEAFYEAFVDWFVVSSLYQVDAATIKYALSSGYEPIVSVEYSGTLWFMAQIFTLNGKCYIPKNFMEDRDPVFMDVRDKSHANFVWFIRFESSFRESETILHEDVVESPPECSIISFSDYKDKRSK